MEDISNLPNFESMSDKMINKIKDLDERGLRKWSFHNYLRNAGEEGTKMVKSTTIVEYVKKVEKGLDEDGRIDDSVAEEYPTAFNKFKDFSRTEWDIVA